MSLFYRYDGTNIDGVSILYVFKNSCLIEFDDYETRQQFGEMKKKNGRLTFYVSILIWSKMRSNCKKEKKTVRYKIN